MTDLERLKITEREIETLSGFDVDRVFIGGVFGGVYRPSIFRSPKRLIFFCLNEIFVFILTFIFTLPIGLLAIRDFPHTSTDVHMIFRFLQVTLGITSIAVISWNIYMWIKVERIKTLTQLLDEIDKYNEILQAIALLDKLEAVGNIKDNLLNRNEVIAALNIARDSLVCGLMTEKTLRENRSLLARRYDLLVNIENNLTTLRTLEITNQADEYGQFLKHALQIGTSVHQEMRKLYRLSRPQL